MTVAQTEIETATCLRLRSHLRNASAWQAGQTPSAVTDEACCLTGSLFYLDVITPALLRSISSGIQSATILVFKDWRQERNRYDSPWRFRLANVSEMIQSDNAPTIARRFLSDRNRARASAPMVEGVTEE